MVLSQKKKGSMNKLALGLIVISIAASSFVTYQVTRTNAVDMSEQYVKKDEIKKLFDEYIEQGAETVFAAAVKGAELQKQAEAEKQRQAVLDSKAELENDPTSPFMGNENGDVTIVMFSDYRCGYCKKSAAILEKLVKNDDGLKVIIKEYPVLGRASVVSSTASLAAFNLDKSKFAAFNKNLFEKPLNSEIDLLAMAEAVGLDGKAVMAEMAKPSYGAIIANNMALGNKLGIKGTPAFVIDGVLYPGAMPEEQFVALIEHTRNKHAAEPAAAPADAAAAQ
jgi:protein-disulfide isomerase